MNWEPSATNGPRLGFNMATAVIGFYTFTFRVKGGTETAVEETFTIEVYDKCEGDFYAPIVLPTVWPAGSLLQTDLSHDEANDRFIKLIDNNIKTIPLVASS